MDAVSKNIFEQTNKQNVVFVNDYTLVQQQKKNGDCARHIY